MNENVINNGVYTFSLSLVHVLGSLLTIMTILSAFGIKFISRLKLFFGNSQQTYVFLGFNEESLNLIKSLKAGGKSRCFIVVESLQDGEEDGDLLLKLREDRFILIDAVWQDLTGMKAAYSKRLLNRELHIFALSSNESINARVILAFLKQAQTGKWMKTKLNSM